MKDEIKEILDNLRIYAGREENGFICDIEDYIINLQEEINKLTAESTEWESKCYDLQKENERLKETNKELLEKFSNKIEEVSNLIKENERLKERCEYLQRSCERKEEQMLDYRMEYMEQEDYKSRNEKAIDKLYCYGEVFDRDILKQFQKEMLDILQESGGIAND